MSAERSFLVVYDWACGQLVSVEELRDDGDAASRRAEAAYAGDDSIEVAVARAGSFDELRRTHERWFRGALPPSLRSLLT